MKKIDLGQTIAILANVGVIAGIGFFAIELQQNNELAGVVAKAQAGEALSAAEQRQLRPISDIRLSARS